MTKVRSGDCPWVLSERLAHVPDPRFRPAFTPPCLLAIASCAMTVAGYDGLTSVGQWIAGASQRDQERLRAPYDVLLGRFRAPSETTVRRIVDRVEPKKLSLLPLGSRPGPGSSAASPMETQRPSAQNGSRAPPKQRSITWAREGNSTNRP